MDRHEMTKRSSSFSPWNCHPNGRQLKVWSTFPKNLQGHLPSSPYIFQIIITVMIYSKIRTSFNAKIHHQNQRHFGAPSIDFSWHIRISGLPDSLGNIFIKWKIFLNLFQKNLFLQKKIFGWDTARPKWLPVGQPNLTLSHLDFTIIFNFMFINCSVKLF